LRAVPTSSTIADKWAVAAHQTWAEQQALAWAAPQHRRRAWQVRPTSAVRSWEAAELLASRAPPVLHQLALARWVERTSRHALPAQHRMSNAHRA